MLKMWVAVALVLGLWAEADIIKPIEPDRQPAITLRYPLVTAPKRSEPPKLDGRIETEEWRKAVQLLPLLDYETGLPVHMQTTIWLCYGDEALYVAWRVRFPPGAPPAQAKARAGDVVEVVLRDIFGDSRSSSFAVDPSGRQSMGHYLPGYTPYASTENGIDHWQTAAQVTGGGYSVEMAIPFRVLYRQTPTPGDTWECQFFSRRQLPAPTTQAFVPLGAAYAEPPMGYLRFGSLETPGIQFVPPADGTACRLQVYSKAETQLQVDAELLSVQPDAGNVYRIFDWLSSSTDRLVPARRLVSTASVLQRLRQALHTEQTWQKRIEAAHYQDGAFTLTLATPIDHGLLHARLRSSEGQLLVACSQPVRTQALDIETRWGGQRNRRLWGQVQVAPWLTLQREARTRIRLATAEKGTLVETWAENQRFRVEVPAGISGSVWLEAAVVHDGKEQAKRVVNRMIPEPAAWHGNVVGTHQSLPRPPAPWSAVQVNDAGDVVIANGRVHLGPQLMPVQLGKADVNLLASPVTLEIESERQVTAGPARIVRRNPWEVRHALELSGQGVLTGNVAVTTAYDGFLHYQLRLSPVGQRQVAVRRVTLRIPLRRELAAYFRRGPGETRAYRSHTDWRTGVVPGDGLALPFSSCLWLGNRDLGLELVMASDQHWFPLDRRDAIRLEMTDDAAVIVVSFVTRQPQQPQHTTLQSEAVFEWGLQMTPVVQRDPGQAPRLVADSLAVSPLTLQIDEANWNERLARYRRLGADALWLRADRESRGRVVWHPDGPQPGFPAGKGGARWQLDALGNVSALIRRSGMRTCLVDVYGHLPTTWPDVNPWQDVLGRWPTLSDGQRREPELNDAYSDWFMHHLAELLDDTAVNGVVLDGGAFPWFSADPATGSGWYDGKGQLRGCYPVFALRRFHERLWLAMHGRSTRGGDVQIVVATPIFPYSCVTGFIDSLILNSPVGLTPEPGWRTDIHSGGSVDGLPVLHDLAELPPFWMPVQEALPMYRRDRLLGEPPAGVRLWSVFDRFPWANSRRIDPDQLAEWVSGVPDSLLCRLRVAPGKAALLSIVNPEDTAVHATMTIAVDRLLLPQDLRVTDVATGQEVKLDGEHTLQRSISGTSWQVYYLEPPPEE